MRQFSQRGERVTDFERSLVAEARDTGLTEFRALLVTLATRIGVDALVIVLDELGGGAVEMPTRESFFQSIYRQFRNDLIMMRLARGDSVEAISDDLGVHRNTVLNVKRAHVTGDVVHGRMVDGAP